METLTLTDFGLHIGKHSERLVVKKGKETVSEHPLINLEQVVVASRGISVSSDAIAECVERGIPVTFVDFSGKPYAKIVSPALTATVKTRREQLLAYYDERGVEIVRRFAEGKMRNQINLLRYFGKYRKEAQPEVFEQLQGVVGKMAELVKELTTVNGSMGQWVNGQWSMESGEWRMKNGQRPDTSDPIIHQPTNSLPPSPPDSSGLSASRSLHPFTPSPIDVLRERFMNVEGRAAALYWSGVRAILPNGLFEGREHRGASDVVNVLLNYGYGILYSQVWTALTLAGLEPFGGFLHVDRPGKPSLVLDFIEEFRQPIVDRTVFALLNKGFQVEWELPNEQELKAQHQAVQPPPTPPCEGGEAGRMPALQPHPFAVLVVKPYVPRREAGRMPALQPHPSAEPPNHPTPQLPPLQEQRRLSAATRKAFAAKVWERLNDEEPFEGKRHKLKNVIQMQARHLATFLRRVHKSLYQTFSCVEMQARHLATFLRREGEYEPFVMKW